MRLTAWTWIIFGIIMAAVSGYIYLFVPKNGQPNNAMALFFFIGIIFIVTGVIKLLFKRVDDKEIFDSVEKNIQNKPENLIKIPEVERRSNKVDEAINHMANRHMQNIPAAGQQHAQQQASQAPHQPHHTNSYYQIHQYKGPVHTQSTGTHAQHPVSQHSQHPQHNPAHASAQQHIQNTSDHGIRCNKCGNVNAGHANYCHGCGNRLR